MKLKVGDILIAKNPQILQAFPRATEATKFKVIVVVNDAQTWWGKVTNGVMVAADLDRQLEFHDYSCYPYSIWPESNFTKIK